ncbi:MAG: NAD(P)/FAD-dependent oxidoreductase [Prevotella sp.]|jgi:sulfide:quinone oxidoreductase|nr:NAD(P)/FAD-dependent oxidoreductase [Prevotella sp.]
MSDNKKYTRRKFLKIAAATGVVGGIAAAGIYKATEFSSDAKGKIVIIGGGAAGLSMAALLQRWLNNPDITLIDPSDRQYYQPGFTLVASGVYEPDEVWKKQEDCIPGDVKWIKDIVVELNPDSKKVRTANNGNLSYDFLVLTPGLQIDWDRMEGISRATLGQGNAHTIYDFEGAQKTWTALQEFAKNGGKAVFTDTYTKHKCGGAPKKICLLTDDYGRKQETRDKMQLSYFTAEKALYDVPYYVPRLLEIYNERNIPITLHTQIKAIDTAAKRVYMEKIETIGEEKVVTPITEDYDFLHFTPPMSAPGFVRDAGLSWTEGKLAADGWVMVNKETLIHERYSNIVCLGDCAGYLPARHRLPCASKCL